MHRLLSLIEEIIINHLYSLTNKPNDQPHIEAAEVIDGS